MYVCFILSYPVSSSSALVVTFESLDQGFTKYPGSTIESQDLQSLPPQVKMTKFTFRNIFKDIHGTGPLYLNPFTTRTTGEESKILIYHTNGKQKWGCSYASFLLKSKQSIIWHTNHYAKHMHFSPVFCQPYSIVLSSITSIL